MKNSRGFIKLIIMIAIGLIVLGYFGLNIREILAKPGVQENLAWLWEMLQTIWNYISGPVMWIWEHVIKMLWNLFTEGLSGLENGEGASALMDTY